MAKHVNEEPEPLWKVAPWVPRRLCEIVMRMVAKDPDERYQSAREVIAALEELSAGTPPRPTELRHAGRLTAKRKPRRAERERRNKLILAGVIAALVAVAAALVAIAISRS